MNDATSVFTRIDKDLSALGGCIGIDEQKIKEFEAGIVSLDSDFRNLLFCVYELERGRKAQMDLIEALQLDIAFTESNAGVDVQRLQRLEEQVTELLSSVTSMQGKLCTCGGKVRISLL